MAKVNAAFEKAYPNIKLNFTYVPPNDIYQEKLQSQLLAGNAADVIMVDNMALADMQEAVKIVDGRVPIEDLPWVSVRIRPSRRSMSFQTGRDPLDR